jgi:hypothetical protein
MNVHDLLPRPLLETFSNIGGVFVGARGWRISR